MENKKEVSTTALAIIKKMQQNELTESYIYKAIAKFAKGDENKAVLERLSKEELGQYEIWKSYSGVEMKPQKRKIFKYKLTENNAISLIPCLYNFLIVLLRLEYF